MIDSRTVSATELLEERLVRGQELLFDMEQRGERSGEYQRYLHLWRELLAQYERLQAA